jgi:hypothetical protein
MGDGLIPYAYKAKSWITMPPLILASIIGMSVVYANNTLTQHKMEGQRVFPGEYVFRTGGSRR